MSGGLSRLADALASEQQPQDTYGTATYLRTDPDGTAWVRLVGSDMETPANGGTTVDAREGDTVTVRQDGTRLYIMGNGTAPAVGQQQVVDIVSPVQRMAEAAGAYAQSALESAGIAAAAAESAVADAARAEVKADEATAAASTANTAAQGALLGLSTVEDVVDTLTWITKHGTMTLTTDTAVDPSKVYFVPDASGQYVVGGSTYSIVQNPTTEGLSGYYELTIDKSVENYIATHVAVTNEGLWLTPTSSNGYRVLIATGAGSTYTTAGTYIINASGTVVAQFTTTNARVGSEGGSHVSIETDGVSIHGSDASVGVTISATSGVESVYGTERLNGNALRAYADDAGYTTRDYDQRSFLVGSGRSLTAGSPLHVVLKEGSSTGTQEWIVSFVAGTSKSVTLNPLNKAGYTLSYGGGRSVYLRRTSAAESQDLEVYYRLHEVRYYEQLHAPMISMGSADSSGAPFTTRFGEGLLADGDHQAVFGKFNEADSNDQYAIIVGNGTADDARSNALTVDWDGRLWLAGNITATAIELETSTPYIDFHFDNSTADYTSRIIENASGHLNLIASNGVSFNGGALGRDSGGTGQTGTSQSNVTLSDCTVSGQRCWHNGVTCSVTMIGVQLSSALANGASVAFGTLPSDYRPSQVIYDVASSTNATFCGRLVFRVGSDGALSVTNRSGSSMPAGTSFSLFVTFAI